LDVNDYLIDQEDKDWADLLSSWQFLLPESFSVWLVNRLGDIFLVFDDGSVHMLDTGRGVIERLADSCDGFVTLLDQDDNGNKWLMVDLVDDCVAGGLRLSPTQCYGFKIPPMLGGKYEVDNLEPTDLSVHYSLLGDIARQTKDLAPGTKVNISIKGNS